jgi:hypothetical protein
MKNRSHVLGIKQGKTFSRKIKLKKFSLAPYGTPCLVRLKY